MQRGILMVNSLLDQILKDGTTPSHSSSLFTTQRNGHHFLGGHPKEVVFLICFDTHNLIFFSLVKSDRFDPIHLGVWWILQGLDRRDGSRDGPIR